MSDREQSAPPGRRDPYLTIDEFAALSTDAQIAVWQAHARGAVESVPATGSRSCPHRYRRDQVRKVLAELRRESGKSEARDA